MALDRIKQRISNALNEYGNDNDEEKNESEVVVNFEHINDPIKLYELLSDSRIRTKYENRLTIVLVGMEESCQARVEALHSIEDFFQESKSNISLKLLGEVETEKIDIEDSTEAFDTAMESTMKAASKLTSIVTDIRQALATAAAYPDNKKGKKKLEKALIKAENEIRAMSNTIDEFKAAQEKNQEEYSELQKTLESKNTEYTTLRKTADETKKTNYSLRSELSVATASLKKAEEELSYLRNNPPAKPVKAEPLVIQNDVKVKELEQALETSQKAYQELQVKSDEQKKSLLNQMSTIKDQNEKHIEELKSQYEGQIQALASKQKVKTRIKYVSAGHATPKDSMNEENILNEEEEEVDETDEGIETALEKTDEAVAETILKGDSEDVKETVLEADKSIVTASPETISPEAVDASSPEAANETVDTKEEQLQTDVKKRTSLTEGEAIVIETLQREHIEKENALKAEMARIKEKYKKKVEALKGQLIEAQNNLETKMATLQSKVAEAEVVELTNKLQDIQTQNHELQKRADCLKCEKEKLLQENNQQSMQITELEETNKQLLDDLQTLDEQLLQQSKDLASRSTQWSEHGLPSSSRLALSRERSVIPMEEVIYPNEEESSCQSMTFTSELKLQTLSQTSVQLHGSPLHSPPVIGNIPTEDQLPVFGHTPAAEQLSIDHPIIQDWRKAYKQVMKFKENILESIQSHHNNTIPATLHDIIQGLENQADLELDEEKDLQGQVTQMRFTLSLTLHQLENAIAESLTVPHDPSSSELITTQHSTNHLELQLAALKQKMQQCEERHQAELVDSQDTITNLSIKIESLKSEIVHLRHLLEQSNEGKVGAVFFTRLDADRNEKALQESKVNKHISEEVYESVSSKMEDYVSIPNQQFQAIAQKLKQETQTKKAIATLQLSSFSPEHTNRIINLIKRLQDRRVLSFNQMINQLSTKRLKLAENLQVILSKIEQETGVFLIKPIYPSRPNTSLMHPLRRAPPSHAMRRTTPPSTAKSCTYKSVIESGQNTPHPTLRLINNIKMMAISANQKQHTIEHLIPTEPVATASTQHSRPPMSVENTAKWSVGNSRLSSTTAMPLSFSPVTPKLVELETSRLREPAEALLLKSSLLQPHREISKKTVNSSPLILSQDILKKHSGTLTLPPICIPASHTDERSINIKS